MTTKLRGLTDAEISELRAALALLDLDKIVSVRVHKQKYAYNSVDIRPTKRAGTHPDASYMPWWTDVDFERVQAFVQSQNLTTRGCPIAHENARIVFGGGFNYMDKLA